MNHIYQIDYDKLSTYTDRIEQGTVALDRLSLAEEQGRISGGRRIEDRRIPSCCPYPTRLPEPNVEASLILGGSTTDQCVTTSTSSSTGKACDDGTRTEQEHLLEQWARHEGIFESWEVVTKRIPYDLTGTEAKVGEYPHQLTCCKRLYKRVP
jgi:hypothetical protein